MPEYHYQAKKGPDQLIEGVIEAPTEASAIERISQQGVVPVSLSLIREKITPDHAAPKPHSVRFKRSENFLFSRNLARLIRSGVPILKAIYLLMSQEKDHRIKEVLRSLEREIREGKTLSRAMEPYSQVFSPMYVSVIRAGEMSGRLQEALSQMAVYFKRQEELASKVRRALAYPMVLMVGGLASIFFVITFLVPRLGQVFTTIGHELPFPTRVILKLGSFMQHAWVVLIVVLGILIFLVPRFVRDRVGKQAFDALKLKVPLLGDLIIKVEFARFGRMLGLCFSSGISFVEALRVVIPAVENVIIRNALEDCALSVEKGSSFGQALKRNPLFPDLAINLISVGEESGKVQETLVEMADIYEQETDELLMYLTTFLEPFMILFVGLIIGFIVVAVLLPIFEMNATL